MDEPDKLTSSSRKPRMPAAQLLKWLGILTALSLLAFAYSYFIEPRRLVVNQQELHIADLNAAADGLKIVAISDIHGGSNGIDEAKLRLIVETANAQNADMIALLGDYVSQTGARGPDGRRPLRMSVETIAANLAGLRAKHGVFAVLGNHDAWYSDALVAAAFESVGYNVLNGEVTVIERNGSRLRILGTKDHQQLGSPGEYSADARKLLAATEGADDVLVLQHSPDIVSAITGEHKISNDLKLMLAGHTHGGQVWFPVFGRPVVPSNHGQKLAAGHVREYGLDIFVTTGIGSSILPFRFMVPPEVAVLTLRRK